MIKIKKPDVPDGYMSCYNCGNKYNDIKNIVVYESVVINNRIRRVDSMLYGLTLCKECRKKLKELL